MDVGAWAQPDPCAPPTGNCSDGSGMCTGNCTMTTPCGSNGHCVLSMDGYVVLATRTRGGCPSALVQGSWGLTLTHAHVRARTHAFTRTGTASISDQTAKEGASTTQTQAMASDVSLTATAPARRRATTEVTSKRPCGLSTHQRVSMRRGPVRDAGCCRDRVAVARVLHDPSLELAGTQNDVRRCVLRSTLTRLLLPTRVSSAQQWQRWSTGLATFEPALRTFTCYVSQVRRLFLKFAKCFSFVH